MKGSSIRPAACAVTIRKVLVPFAWLSWYAQWAVTVRIGAGVLVLLFGVCKLVWPRHSRALARIRPTQIA